MAGRLRKLGWLIAALSACLAATTPEAVAREAGRADSYTPVVQSVMSTPRWFRDAEGQRRLVYELRLTNAFPVSVTVKAASVRDTRDNAVLQRLSASALDDAMTLMASPGTPETTIPASGSGVIWMDVPLGNHGAVPKRLRHTLTVKVPPGLPVPKRITTTGASTRVDRRPPTVLGPPLRGAGWIAVGSCCDGPHRRSIQPVNGRLWLGQRFAIDWNGMNTEHRWVVGDPSLNESWIFFGAPVLAVAGAKVVAAVDRFRDQVPNDPRPVTIEQADGNYVILKLSPGHYAFYAHLENGSVRVEPGDRVHRGEVLGRLGNSGSSTGPHLHFQLMNKPSALASDGLPYVFSRFRREGRIPPLTPELAAEVEAGEPTPLEPVPAGPHRDQLPLGRDVVAFPGSGR